MLKKKTEAYGSVSKKQEVFLRVLLDYRSLDGRQKIEQFFLLLILSEAFDSRRYADLFFSVERLKQMRNLLSYYIITDRRPVGMIFSKLLKNLGFRYEFNNHFENEYQRKYAGEDNGYYKLFWKEWVKGEPPKMYDGFEIDIFRTPQEGSAVGSK